MRQIYMRLYCIRVETCCQCFVPLCSTQSCEILARIHENLNSCKRNTEDHQFNFFLTSIRPISAEVWSYVAYIIYLSQSQ